jgi:heme-degrading monooxygenase HmoA
MHARTSTLSVPADTQDDAIQRYRDGLSRVRQIPGNRGTFLLVDRNAGRGISVTLWGSEQAMADRRDQATRLRQQAATEASGEVISVDEFEIAVWDVDAN